MSSSNWQKIEEIFDEAAELPLAEREAFLNEACGANVELRREVEDLLAADEASNDFIESPIIASNTLANMLPENIEDSVAPHFIGRRIGAYELVRELGRGGMGAVFLARRADSEFRKDVAVKLVKRGMDTDFILKRFRNERQILAHLDHPNVARLLDGGTSDGLPYFVMEYVEGLPVHQFCDSQRLSVDERLRLFQSICAAVGYAHQNQIIHRDLKPNNILVTRDGAPKLLDFGIAKILDPDFAGDTLAPTLTGMRLMTPEYASPEQIRGETLTTASDIYSLGVLLFEILTGERPYKFPSRAPHEVARVICEDAPLRLSDSQKLKAGNKKSEARAGNLNLKIQNADADDQICEDLENIIYKSLRKSPHQRYATAEAFAEDIQKYLNGLPVSATLMIQDTDESFENSFVQTESLAVLPFRTIQIRKTGDSGDYLSLGLTDSLITRLSRLKTISVRPTSSVLRYSNHDSIEPNAAGKELRVTHILDGRIQQVGNRVRLTAQLVKISNNETVWAGQFDEESEDILILQDSISAQVAQALVKELTGEEREQIENRGTDNPKAYEAYLRGRVYWHSHTVEGLAKALVAFYEAIALDPNFALPYSGVADYYNFLSVFGVMSPHESFPAAKEAASKAVELDDHSAEAYTSLGIATLGYDWNFELAEKYLKRALELNPNYAEAHVWYAHLLGAQGKHDLAVKSMNRAERLSPQSLSMLTSFALCLRNAKRYEEGLEKLRRSLVLQPNYPTALQAFSWFVVPLKNYEEAESAAFKALEITGRQNISLYNYAYVLAIVGNRREALKIAEELKERREKLYVPCMYLAWLYSALGDTEEIFRWLDQAVTERDFWLVFFAVDSRFDEVEDDERYGKIIERIKPFKTEDEEIHQSHIATKILPAAETETPKNIEAVAAQTVEIAAPTPPRRVWLYAFFGALVPVLIIIAAFVGMRFGWFSAGKNADTNNPVLQPSTTGVQKTLAILPFTPNESGEREDSLSVSLAQVFTDKLGQIRRISVIPANFSENQSKTLNDALEAGRELGTDFVLHGALHQSADRIQISAALVAVADGKIWWQENFDESLTDLPKLQISIPDKILRALAVELSPDERRQIEKTYTTDGEAYRLYLDGRYQMTARTAESMHRSIKTFTASRDKDPNFALAYAGLADAYALLNLYEIPPPAGAYDKAKENALKALTIDSTLAETHASLAYVLFNHDGNMIAAETNYRRAIELNPSYPRSFHWFALMLSANGKHEEAIEKIKTAQKLAPRSAIVHAAAALVYFYANRYQEAIDFCHKSLEINKKFVPAYKNLRVIYEATGEYENALAAYKNERLYSDDTDEENPNWLMIKAQVEAVGGKREGALKSLTRAIAESSVKNNPGAYSYEIAAAYALLGEKKDALEWLEIAEKSRANNYNFAAVDARFEKIRR